MSCSSYNLTIKGMHFLVCTTDLDNDISTLQKQRVINQGVDMSYNHTLLGTSRLSTHEISNQTLSAFHTRLIGM